MLEMKRVVVIIKEGLVQEVFRPKDIVVEIVDLDTEGEDEEDLCKCTMAEVPHWHSGHGGDWGE